MELGLYLKQKREELKIPRRVIAKKLYITPETLRDIEHGKIRLSLENFLIICEELDLSPMQLIKKNNENYILLSNDDLKVIEESINVLNKIKKQIKKD